MKLLVITLSVLFCVPITATSTDAQILDALAFQAASRAIFGDGREDIGHFLQYPAINVFHEVNGEQTLVGSWWARMNVLPIVPLAGDKGRTLVEIVPGYSGTKLRFVAVTSESGRISSIPPQEVSDEDPATLVVDATNAEGIEILRVKTWHRGSKTVLFWKEGKDREDVSYPLAIMFVANDGIQDILANRYLYAMRLASSGTVGPEGRYNVDDFVSQIGDPNLGTIWSNVENGETSFGSKPSEATQVSEPQVRILEQPAPSLDPETGVIQFALDIPTGIDAIELYWGPERFTAWDDGSRLISKSQLRQTDGIYFLSVSPQYAGKREEGAWTIGVRVPGQNASTLCFTVTKSEVLR